jgi:hypothetical protein
MNDIGSKALGKDSKIHVLGTYVKQERMLTLPTAMVLPLCTLLLKSVVKKLSTTF